MGKEHHSLNKVRCDNGWQRVVQRKNFPLTLMVVVMGLENGMGMEMEKVTQVTFLDIATAESASLYQKQSDLSPGSSQENQLSPQPAASISLGEGHCFHHQKELQTEQ